MCEYGSLVKRLRRRPLTAETRVRFPYELLTKEIPVGISFFISQEIASCEIKMLRRDAQLAEMKSSLCEPLVRRDCATAQSLLFYRKLYPIKQNLRLHCHSCRKGEPYEKIH